MRTAFAAEQLSTLESSFQHRRYLGPLERRTLAQKVRLSEVQIKTWFQNRRMKRQRQHAPELCAPGFPSPLSALGSGLQLLHPWASLPGPWALAQPPGSFWDPCQVEQLPPARCTRWAPPGPGGPGAHVSCQRPRMPFEEVGQPRSPQLGCDMPSRPTRAGCVQS
ncbi:Homeobox protein VENTX [Pteropus alecto]|uniref:Homeobox protein VENTX n=1 Tax=Pteropus alecto TaxID=9402 RepID=L5KMI4_PTEAL|nr:Homeobox protein VENTX [Pteropus alecto]